MLARVAVHLGCLLVLETRFSLEEGFDERRQTVGHRMFFDSCGGPCNIAKHCSLSGAAGMSAIPVLVEDEFIRRFFCQCDFRPHAAFIVDDISAFIKMQASSTPFLFRYSAARMDPFLSGVHCTSSLWPKDR